MKWLLPCVFMLLSLLITLELLGKLNKAHEQQQALLLHPLRWQITGRILFGLGWCVDGVSYLSFAHSDHLLVPLMVTLWGVGFGAMIYGHYWGKAVASRICSEPVATKASAGPPEAQDALP